MSLSQPTFDDVWKLIQETNLSMRESERKFTETSAEFRNELRAMSQESDRKFWERSRETDKRIKQVTESVGRLSDKLGDFVEEMVRPAAVRLFKERGIEVHEVHQNVSANRNGEGIAINLLVVNDGDVVAIECKSTLSIDNVNWHLARLEKIKRLLPTYANKRIMGAVTGMVIAYNVAQYAYRQGLFVIAQTGSQLALRNDLKFEAKIW